MNTQRIADVNRKLPGGTEVIFNGNLAYVEHDRQDGFINLRPTKAKNHKEDDTFLISKSEISLSPKLRSGISAKPKPPTEKKKKDTGDLNSFFDSLAAKVPFNCQSCRRALYAFNKKAKRASCAHLLPKSIFKSIATNTDNIVFLGVDVFGASCFCHSQYDSTVEKRKKMPIYELALKRYELLKPHLTEAEIQLADEYLGISVKSGNLLKDIQEGKA